MTAALALADQRGDVVLRSLPVLPDRGYPTRACTVTSGMR